MFRLIVIASIFLALGCGAPTATAGPFDFLRRVGRSITHPRHAEKHRRTVRQRETSTPDVSESDDVANEEIAATRGEQAGAQGPAPPAEQPPVPSASATPRAGTNSTAPANLPTVSDLPYGMAVPNHPGMVVSPYSSGGGWVDVSGFASGAPVKDPYTGKIFRVP
ncbi:MAG: hypothetical protein ACJ8KU_00295 [Chthoniobacterales bacterium]